MITSTSVNPGCVKQAPCELESQMLCPFTFIPSVCIRAVQHALKVLQNFSACSGEVSKRQAPGCPLEVVDSRY